MDDDEKRLSLRLPAVLHARLVEAAHADRRSVNSEIIHLLEVALGAVGGDDSSL
ncbi:MULTISPECIES: Arc family DNA-binding protein [unclassified Streptomyces]|uniref:Arc family DNA-binding protein n=1 Tax=Streptomyces evansiae TaxID=3075535 RepID=A0ABD5ECN1_9ACTN|nr:MULTISPECIES: Arc family DNA-binding protein [unclassified Streptomyces]ASY33211.1 antitoxin [Streptomyces sp. CLI2509]MDT0418537.1 Arc family DNA-binding protein [Streptomyces sp. DSM 41982]MDT0421329.1 Arc family DNA-binding protein [Streptomyces sp. DSM 41859]MYX24198.1 Arc family DNA-binding protein [Streptomyces sp. SID8380]NJA58388.1 Arc family DNA-binding protein [Streptomyces sp. NEAU-H3]